MSIETTRTYGLYYPLFHVRDDGWLKAMALYWPKITRMVPSSTNQPDRLVDYFNRPSSFADPESLGPGEGVARTIQALTEKFDFINEIPPGPSVEAVAPAFEDALSRQSLTPLQLFRPGLPADPINVAARHKDEAPHDYERFFLSVALPSVPEVGPDCQAPPGT
ncbi:hypothetical protein V2S66_19060 [Streptomyces sp. V4-01]|uniref:Uncharacterized protein n=1 Tax=Actinacidiphila polyblastidii TaxID=3110430 RepID=A0ABU7PE21_9ACTN|nr:hypothetical protein [Streptomyces sp. V4-01]